MIAAVLTRSIVDRRRAIIGYGIGLGLMVVWVMAIYPSVAHELADYVNAMPEAMKSLFGMEDITSLAGFVHAEIFSLMGPLVFLALAITTGAAAIAGEERDRVLPIVLSTGVRRRDLVLSKFAALVLDVMALAALTLASLLVGLLVAGGGIAIASLVSATIQLAALGALFGAIALAAGAVTGRKPLASAVAVAVALGSYLLDVLANLVGWLGPFEVLSPFHWYAPRNPLAGGVAWGGLALLVGSSLLVTLAGVIGFDRRDVGT